MNRTEMKRLSDQELVRRLVELQREVREVKAAYADLRADWRFLRRRVSTLETKLKLDGVDEIVAPEERRVDAGAPPGSCVHWVPPGTFCHQCQERIEA